MFTRRQKSHALDVTSVYRQVRSRAARPALASVLAGGALCAAVAVTQPAFAAPRQPAVTFTRLTLLHGWQTYTGAAHPAVADISGIVTFKGMIFTNGTNPVPFILPKAFRPSTDVYVAVALAGANKGQLKITPAGVVTVQAEDNLFSNATYSTTLDGVSFAKSVTSFTKLKLQNGWLKANGTSAAAARVISGIVHLKGAIHTYGTNPVAFTLPKGYRPAAIVRLPVDLCGAGKGRLEILPNGVASVSAEINFSDAACLTSLDGVTFATSRASFSPVSLENGWQSYGRQTYRPEAKMTSGIVYLEGAISNNDASNPSLTAFTLPKSMRPGRLIFIEIDLCGANNGHLAIQPNGVVELYAEGGTLEHLSCFASLDGAWFAR